MGKAKTPSNAAELPRVVLVDANVFFGPRMRDLVMHLHEAGVIRVHWTKEIEDEWSRNVVKKQDADPQDIEACLQGMRKAAPGWQINGYAKHIPRFAKVHKKDQHVAAAAYKLSLDDWPGQRVTLLTKNVKDFPASAFIGTNVTRYGLGIFMEKLYTEEGSMVLKVVEGCIKKLKHPPITHEQYVAMLVVHGCDSLAGSLATVWKVECPKIDKHGKLYYESDRPKKPAAKKKAK